MMTKATVTPRRLHVATLTVFDRSTTAVDAVSAQDVDSVFMLRTGKNIETSSNAPNP